MPRSIRLLVLVKKKYRDVASHRDKEARLQLCFCLDFICLFFLPSITLVKWMLHAHTPNKKQPQELQSMCRWALIHQQNTGGALCCSHTNRRMHQLQQSACMWGQRCLSVEHGVGAPGRSISDANFSSDLFIQHLSHKCVAQSASHGRIKATCIIERLNLTTQPQKSVI